MRYSQNFSHYEIRQNFVKFVVFRIKLHWTHKTWWKGCALAPQFLEKVSRIITKIQFFFWSYAPSLFKIKVFALLVLSFFSPVTAQRKSITSKFHEKVPTTHFKPKTDLEVKKSWNVWQNYGTMGLYDMCTFCWSQLNKPRTLISAQSYLKKN